MFKYFILLIAANLVVGFLPIFWALFAGFEIQTVLLHRCFWTFSLMVPLIALSIPLKDIWSSIKNNFFYIILSSLCIGINWFVYIYAINSGQILEASLAYFIAPLISVFLSYIFLKEKITQTQKTAIALAFSSIFFLFVVKGIFPKYGLIIATSFSLYGIFGRKVGASVVLRIGLECLFVAIFLFIFYQSPKEFSYEFLSFSWSMKGLFILSGLLTGIPFFCLNTSLKHIPYSVIGMMGFMVPTLIFFIGIFHFHEEFDRDKMYVLIFVWTSLVIYISGFFKAYQKPVVASK